VTCSSHQGFRRDRDLPGHAAVAGNIPDYVRCVLDRLQGRGHGLLTAAARWTSARTGSELSSPAPRTLHIVAGQEIAEFLPPAPPAHAARTCVPTPRSPWPTPPTGPSR
jgi:hypothetical protein